MPTGIPQETEQALYPLECYLPAQVSGKSNRFRPVPGHPTGPKKGTWRINDDGIKNTR